jgi:hypothetical protein
VVDIGRWGVGQLVAGSEALESAGRLAVRRATKYRTR